MLHIDHRPKSLDEMVGNEATVEALQKILDKPDAKRPRSYLFEGKSGCGKTTLARIIANEMGATGVRDFHELDAASNRGVDTIRALQELMMRKPMGDKLAFVIDEAHQLTGTASSSMLKMLEDTPAHVIFILATTDPDKLLPTILNRCVRFKVKPLDEDEMFTLLRKVAKAEDTKVPKNVLSQIAESCGGSPRQGLQILNKVGDLDPDNMAEMVENYRDREAKVIDLCRALFKGTKKWTTICSILDDLKGVEDEEGIRRAVLGYCGSVLGGERHAQAFIVIDCFLEPFYNSGWPGLLHACYEATDQVEHGRTWVKLKKLYNIYRRT
jgi:DNA polymerase-3 subunit gamma/tau